MRLSHNSDFFSRNCEFIFSVTSSQFWLCFFFRTVRYKLAIRVWTGLSLDRTASGFATVRTLLLIALRFAPYFVLFSDLSKILTSADQHSAQTTHFLEKEDSLPTTASSLHSGDRKIQLSTFKQTRENASSGIYLLHELPQNSTKDCGSWNKVTCWTSKTDETYSRWSPQDPLSIQPVSPVNLVNLNSLYQV